MVKNLLLKKDFATRANVTPAAITKALNGELSKALVGTRIDGDHPSALEYIQIAALNKPKLPPIDPTTGLDPLFDDAARACYDSRTWTQKKIMDTVGASHQRAKALLERMKSEGLVPKKSGAPPVPKVKPAPAVAAPVAVKTYDRTLPDVEFPENIQSVLDLTLRELVIRHGTNTSLNDWLKAALAVEAISEKRLKNAKTEGELVARVVVERGIIDPIETAHRRMLTDGARTMAKRARDMYGADRSVEDVEEFIADQISSFIQPMKRKVARVFDNEN